MKIRIKYFSILIMSFALSNYVFGQEKTYENSIGMQFVLIEPGTMVVGKFQPTINRPAPPSTSTSLPASNSEAGRGSQAQTQAPQTPQTPPRAPQAPLPDSYYKLAEEMARKDAMPGFEVKIDKPYYIGVYPVTQEQWQKVMGNNPSTFQGAKVDGDASEHPVENISWQDAQDFIKKLNENEKGNATYRLPSEFEWEYAARAGATDDISWADIRANAVISAKTTAVVGSKKPNAWGLYDTLGNVWEWVEDVYNEKIFADPVSPKSGKEHVLKGAPFYGDVKNATYMTHAGGPGSGYDTGFRIVMDVKN